MGTTKYFTERVEIDVDLSEWEDEELIEEIRSRGYQVDKEPDMISAEYNWQRGAKKEALILLERQFPEFIGLSKLAD